LEGKSEGVETGKSVRRNFRGTERQIVSRKVGWGAQERGAKKLWNVGEKGGNQGGGGGQKNPKRKR